MTHGNCRICEARLAVSFCDLGMSPLSNAYLDTEKLGDMEPFYPLHARVCGECFLVQLDEFETPAAIFSDYAYFSSYSDSWLAHAKQYTDAVIRRFKLGASHRVVEVASNDGYLLRYFKERGVAVLGVEPAANVAQVAKQAGIPTVVRFFGIETARALVTEGHSADLLVGNNVLAHVPDVNDFVAGMKILLKPGGVITMEFPHLMRLMAENQFDTIYHEHFSYFSLLTAQQLFARHGLVLFDVEELSTHGGSLRIYGRHLEDGSKPIDAKVPSLIARERTAGLAQIETYASFAEQVRETKRKLLEFLIVAKREGKTVVGYGAPAKGNTLLNYCGVRGDFLEYTVDRSPHKQDKFLPGTRIPVYSPDRIRETRPDYVLILPWNLKDEIVEQMAHIREWGGKFVVPIPEVQVVP